MGNCCFKDEKDIVYLQYHFIRIYTVLVFQVPFDKK